MTRLAEVLVLGASIGALYALMGVGVTVVYQASRAPNVAFVGIGTAAAVLHWDLVTPGGRLGGGVGWWPAFAAALGIAAALGVVTDLLVRLLGGRSSLLLLLGWMAALLAGTNALWGSEAKLLPPVWAGPALEVGDFSVQRQAVATLAIAAACGLALVAISRRTRFGLALRASAADAEAAAMMGMDPARLSRGAWALGSALAAVAVILLVYPVLSNTYETTVFLAFAFGAAFLGGFRRLPLAALGGLALGVVPTLLEPSDAVVRIGGVPNLVAFAMIAGLLLKRPALGGREEVSRPVPGPTALPVEIPPWARRVGLLVLAGLLAVAVPMLSSDVALEAWAQGISVFLVCASIVVVCGWSGEVPLGQLAFAGFSAYMAANLTVRLGLPHVMAVPLAAASALPLALVVGLPVLRARGPGPGVSPQSSGPLPFAAVSIGLMVVASSLLWGPRAGWFTGDGLQLPRPDWMDVLSGRPAASYYLLALGLAAGVVWFALNLRRSRVGRALAAVRDSEAAAASLGIDPARYRLVALCFSAFVAGLGGVVHAYLAGSIDPGRFAAFLSVQYLLYTVLGGAGSLAGAAVVVFAFEVAPTLGGGTGGPGPGAVLLLGALCVVAVRFHGLAGLANRTGLSGQEVGSGGR